MIDVLKEGWSAYLGTGIPGRPWERGNDEVMGNAHLHTMVVQSYIIKSVEVKDRFHSWLSSHQQLYYSSTLLHTMYHFLHYLHVDKYTITVVTCMHYVIPIAEEVT